VKGPFALRLIVSAVIIIAIYGIMFVVQAGNRTPAVDFPNWCHKDNDPKKELSINLPLQIGSWSGVKTELDPNIFNATGAKIAENRTYSDDAGHTVFLHIAYFDDVETGVWHAPTNCYRCAGWQCLAGAKMPMEIEGSPAAEVYFTHWDKESTVQCFVTHWYYLGGNMLYGREGLPEARWSLRGRSAWPPLIKILVQNRPNALSDDDKESLLNFSKQIYLWLNDAEHRNSETSAVAAKPAMEKSEPAKTINPAKTK
jgi:EpsI family protein